MALDLGIGNYVSKNKPGSPGNATNGNQYNASEPQTVTGLPVTQIGWSIGQAISQSANNSQLQQTLQYYVGTTNLGRNLQRSALGDFLALYSVTRDNALLPGDFGPPSPIGSRQGLTITNGTSAQKAIIRDALFGDGTSDGSLISEVLVGGVSKRNNAGVITSPQNPLLNFTQVLENLGIDTAPARDHQNHFHIYLTPPLRRPIGDGANLTASETTNVAAVDGGVELSVLPPTETTFSALSGAEEIVMLALVVPAEPPQSPSVVVAQAPGRSELSMRSVKTVTFCRDTQSLIPDSAPNDFSPISDNTV